jgi:hypothetical protein
MSGIRAPAAEGGRVVSEDLIKTIRTHIEKGDKAAEKADQHYIAAGQHLKTLKAQHNGPWKEWEALLKDKVGIGKSRASELMAIADGRTTVEEVRADTAKRVADSKARLKSSASSGEKSTAVEVVNSEDGFNLRFTDPKSGKQYVASGCSYKDDPAAHPDDDSEEADKPWTAAQEDTAREIINTLRRLDTLVQQFPDATEYGYGLDRFAVLIPDQDLAAVFHATDGDDGDNGLLGFIKNLGDAIDEDPRSKPEPQDFEAADRLGKFTKRESDQRVREKLARECRLDRLANMTD